MISYKTSGSLKKTEDFLIRCKKGISMNTIRKYAEEGLNALRQNTPVRTGKTSDSWRYEIKRSNGSVSIIYHNDNIQNGVPIAIIIQYGHGTRQGGWVEGVDYINPSIAPIFDKIVESVWKEVIK